VLHQRALVRYQKGEIAAAYRDLQAVITREPRHFAAWRNLAEIAEAQGNLKAAYAAWQKLLELDPKLQDGEKKRDELRRKVEGERS
jgi:tetratricopeptide (TPR) repeat protein